MRFARNLVENILNFITYIQGVPGLLKQTLSGGRRHHKDRICIVTHGRKRFPDVVVTTTQDTKKTEHE